MTENNSFFQALSEWTRMGPHKRLESINNFSKRMNKTKAVQEVLDEWDMKLNDSPTQLTGRVLNPEVVFLKKQVTYKLQNADWTNCEYYDFSKFANL